MIKVGQTFFNLSSHFFTPAQSCLKSYQDISYPSVKKFRIKIETKNSTGTATTNKTALTV